MHTTVCVCECVCVCVHIKQLINATAELVLCCWQRHWTDQQVFLDRSYKTELYFQQQGGKFGSTEIRNLVSFTRCFLPYGSGIPQKRRRWTKLYLSSFCLFRNPPWKIGFSRSQVICLPLEYILDTIINNFSKSSFVLSRYTLSYKV